MLAPMHVEPRIGDPTLIVVHTNEGPEGPTTAESLAKYLQTVTTGYHVIVDEDSVVQVARDNQVVWGAGGVNSRALHVCITGRAAQSSTEWDDASSSAAVRRAATVARTWALRWRLPVVHLTPTQVRDGKPGLCGHGDVSVYHAASQGHTDPGLHFPWGRFIDLARPLQPGRKHDTMQFLFKSNDGDPRVWLTDGLTGKRWLSSDELLNQVIPHFQAAGWSTLIAEYHPGYAKSLPTVGYAPPWVAPPATTP